MRTNAISLRLDDTVMERLRTRAEAERRPVRTMAALLLGDALEPKLTTAERRAEVAEALSPTIKQREVADVHQGD